MGKRKPNNEWLAKKQAEKAAEQAARTHVDVQLAKDAAVFAANRVFKRKGSIIVEFLSEFNKLYPELSMMIYKDAHDDEEMWYAKEKIDTQLKDIVGEENFQPWDVRYDFSRRQP